MYRTEGGHAPKRRFGQNFLHDPQVIERILRCINPQPGDCVVEIGPGLGALTIPLLERLDRLQAVEIDRDMVPHLETLGGERLHIVQADALEVDFAALRVEAAPLRLVGNLPYNISTPLLFHLLGFVDCIRDMHFMLQKEVVDRITAQPDTADYGRLTVTLAARASSEWLFDVGPGAFKPAPQVTSSLLRIVPRPPPFEIVNLSLYDRVVTTAFNQRRKTLGNALKSLMPAAAIAAAGIDPRTRAETLEPAAFARLAAQLLAG